MCLCHITVAETSQVTYMTTRRNFLIGAASASLLPITQRSWAAESGSVLTPATPRVVMDWHSHYFSKAEIDFFTKRKRAPKMVTDADGVSRLQNVDTASAAAGEPGDYSPSDLEVRIKQLDDNGIQHQLLTHTVALGLDASIPLGELRPLFRAFNDELAQAIAKYPNRFIGVAALPSADPAWAAEELKRAHRELGFIGGSLPLNAFTTLEGARTLAPLFATAQTLNSHFFIHRGPANSKVPGQPTTVIPHDTDYARWNLISNTHLSAGGITLGLSDFLDPYPDVSVEIVMLAGFLPYLFDSLIPAAKSNGVKDPVARIRRVYYDTGPYATRNGEWVALAANKIGADRILFGTDYGVGGGTRGNIAPVLATLDKVLTAEQRQLIYVDNSRALLKAKGRAV